MAVQTNFRVRIYKQLKGQGQSDEWSNEYDIKMPTPVEVTDPALATAVGSLVDFEVSIHTWAIEFKRAVISTQFEDDLVPQDASRTLGLTVTGARSGNNNNNIPLDLAQVLVVNFNGASGRASRHQYRGVLDDQIAPLSPLGYTLVTSARQELTNKIQTLMNSAVGPLLQIANIKDDIITSRPVSSVTLGTVGNRQRHSRRKPKISLDEDAITKRLISLTKELSLVSASLAVRQALGGFDVSKIARLQSALASAKSSADAMVIPV